MNTGCDVMLPAERRKRIQELIVHHGKVDIESLTRQFHVSGMTIRRDLDQLAAERKLVRTHGGAVSPEAVISEMPHADKANCHVEEKRGIAERAASKIPHGARLLLDSGTTVLEVAKQIKDRDDLTVVTNDIKIAYELLDSPLEIISTGGHVQQGIGSMLGAHVQHLLEHVHADVLFLGAHAVDIEAGVTTPTLEKALVKKLMLKAARKTWLLADSSKFSKRSFAHVCHFTQIDGLITDNRQLPGNIEQYEQFVDVEYIPIESPRK
jgi:DeoR/GlpR family transcriptional regulator of sugar metabolism